MSRLTWVRPEDLLAHELVASAHEGRVVDDVARRWLAAGGTVEAPVGGLGPDLDRPGLRALAEELLDVLEARPVDPAFAAGEGLPVGSDPPPGDGAPRRPPGPDLADRVHGAWLGRAAGCLLGKPVEKLPRHAIREILVSQGRWPLDSWFSAAGLPDDVAARWPWNRRSAPTSLAETIDGMPEDDDLNFCLVALLVLERHGRGFTADDVAATWLSELPGGRVFTAERVAYRNLLDGLVPPATATRRNPYREWIGAAIRTDVYGWTSPGDPAGAATMARRDASVSHVGAGVHGAAAVAAMCATALVADGVDEVLEAGLAAVPPGSRYGAALRLGAGLGRSDLPLEAALDELHRELGHLHWVHVLNNAGLLALSLARGRGELAVSITTAVMGGWDTDSTAATAGSVCGALTGASRLPAAWVDRLDDRLASSVPGFGSSSFAALAARTVALAGAGAGA